MLTPNWRKSSFSGPYTDNCVEVAFTDEGILLRDSKNPDAGHFTFNRGEWDAFIDGAKANEFD